MLRQKHVLIIIPCLNESANIEKVIRSILSPKSDFVPLLVVADGGSTDGSQQIVINLIKEFPEIRLLDNPKKLQSAGVNLAVKTFQGFADVMIRIDAHSAYPKNYCDALLSEMERTEADSVTVSVVSEGRDTIFQLATAVAQNSKLGNGGSAHRSSEMDGKWVDHGHHALIKISAFERVGGYNEDFSHNEDAELDTRLTAAGYKIWLTNRVAVGYFPRASPISLFKQYINYGHGRAKTIFKHKSKIKIRQLLPVFILPATCLAILYKVSIIFALPLLVWAALCNMYAIILATKAAKLAYVLSGLSAMVMHLGWSIGFWKAILDKLTHKIP